MQHCFDNSIGAGPIKTTVYIETLGVISINKTVPVNVTATCDSDYHLANGECTMTLQTCNNFSLKYILPFTYYNQIYDGECPSCYGECCYDESTDQCLSICTNDTGVPINNLTCINCTKYSDYGVILFIGVELLPVTLMVIVIIIFNIQLTNGSINAVVFYSQMIAIILSVNGLNSSDTFGEIDFTLFNHLSAIPCYIFNLDFTPFLFNQIPLCISNHMSPLGAISFWYVIGFYPLLLLLLLYVWITLYDKGYKCVVLVTRPFHRCTARFWSMTGIEPSFTHSIASIYILCFTQLTATSFKILSFVPFKFAFNTNQGYFQEWHGFAGFIAIMVLLFVIILPTLCILFYRFKWFQKLLDYLHLRKPLLISLADVFTGPYKNGTENTYDYRFMAGLYLLARIIVLFQFIIGYPEYYEVALPMASFSCFAFLAIVALIFRPFYRNIHNFTEFFTLAVTGTLSILLITLMDLTVLFGGVLGFNIFVFGIILPIYVIYKLCKIIKACRYYHKKRVPMIPIEGENEEDTVDDWVADRMENPQEYDEQHVPVIPA